MSREWLCAIQWEIPSGSVLRPPVGHEMFLGTFSDQKKGLIDRRVLFTDGPALDFQQALRDAAGLSLQTKLTKLWS